VNESDAIQGMLRFECDYCKAPPGVPCTTPTGRRATYPHSARFYKWRDRDTAPSWPTVGDRS
jgi:hypothetical protein